MAITNQIPDYFREKYQLIYTVTFAAFFSAYFAGTWVGIIAQLILIPLNVTALKKAKLAE